MRRVRAGRGGGVLWTGLCTLDGREARARTQRTVLSGDCVWPVLRLIVPQIHQLPEDWKRPIGWLAKKTQVKPQGGPAEQPDFRDRPAARSRSPRRGRQPQPPDGTPLEH